jgi:uncharacterized repeat protein (TIGR03803 family)
MVRQCGWCIMRTAVLVLVVILNDSSAYAQPAYETVAALNADVGRGTRALIEASDGSLYGTTNDGGAFSFGGVFKVDTAGALTVMHRTALSPVGWSRQATERSTALPSVAARMKWGRSSACTRTEL